MPPLLVVPFIPCLSPNPRPACRNDKQVNARLCSVLGLGRQEHPTPWKGLLVGDLVKIEQDRVGAWVKVVWSGSARAGHGDMCAPALPST